MPKRNKLVLKDTGKHMGEADAGKKKHLIFECTRQLSDFKAFFKTLRERIKNNPFGNSKQTEKKQ